VALADMANRPGAPPADELVEMARERRTTRRAWLKAVAASAALAAGARPALVAQNVARGRATTPRIAIVGAGMAGLHAAYVIRKAGLIAQVYCGDTRLGGRMLSVRDALGPGLVTEFGGEFIDTDHDDLHNLAREFGLTLLDLDSPSEQHLRTLYEFGGRRYTEAQIVRGFQPIAAHLRADQATIGDTVSFDHYTPAAFRLDHLSLSEYLDRIGASGPVRTLLEVAYLGEYGLGPQWQSALNLLVEISSDTSDGFAIFGESDERYKVSGGNQRLIVELANRLPGQVQRGHVLRTIRSRGSGFMLTFDRQGAGPRDVAADIVLLAIPFTILREIDVMVPLPDIKRLAIRFQGYGKSGKLLLGMGRRFWRDRGLVGESFSDRPTQETWDNSQLQPGTAGGLTIFLGGEAADRVGDGGLADQVSHFLPHVDALFPGAAHAFNGRAARADWPDNPFVRAGYTCYAPGQYTGIAGAEFLPVGNLFFAGEHTSLAFQGYMNGAAETGRRAAERIIARVRNA
jgi:monoamine oxidase